LVFAGNQDRKEVAMSLNALGNDLARPTQTATGAAAAMASSMRFDTRDVPQSGNGTAPAGAAKALDALSKFIPTEVLAPYVTALSLAVTQGWNVTAIYWYFVAATPVVFVLFSFAKQAIDQKPWPAIVPLAWRTFAATVAFAVWGLSVPTNPLQAAIGGAAVAGFFALIVSPVLWAADAIALRLLDAAPAP
jgi:hypothetical protein